MVTYTQQGHRFRQFEEFAAITSRVHRIHPAVILLAALAYIAVVTSFPPTAVLALIPFLPFPLILGRCARIPLKALLSSTLKVLPLIFVIGMFHPFMDVRPAQVGPFEMSRGLLVFFSLMLKGFLTILANFLMIGLLGIGGLQKAMQSLKIPPLFSMLVALIYRYIMLLLEEVYRTLRAYELRSGRKPRLAPLEWGSLPGGMLIRTYEQGLRIQHAMELRGFDPQHPGGKVRAPGWSDILGLVLWIALLLVLRGYVIPEGAEALGRLLEVPGLEGSSLWASGCDLVQGALHG